MIPAVHYLAISHVSSYYRFPRRAKKVRDVVSSPLYTRAAPIPGQLEIPDGTWHTRCRSCGDGFLCDQGDCRLGNPLCEKCGFEKHSDYLYNLSPLPEIERPAANVRNAGPAPKSTPQFHLFMHDAGTK